MNLKPTVLATVIGGAIAFAPAPAPAAFPLPPTIPMTPVAADPVQKTIDERVKDIETQLKKITEILEGKKDNDGFPIPTDPGLAEEVKQLRNEIAKLRNQIGDMPKSTSQRPTSPAPAGKGKVLIINDYAVEITMLVNNHSYRVAPGTTLEVPVPTGEFTYQLLNSGSLTPTRSTVEENKEVKLRVK